MRIPLIKNEIVFLKREKRERIPLSDEMEQSKATGKLIVLPNESLTPEAYLQNLIDQLRDDVYPLFRKTRGGAPFTVLRNTLCFIDHMSRLLHKPGAPQNINLKKVISKLGSVDPYLNGNYALYANYLIQLYRHDLVHNIRPFPKSLIIIDKNGSREATSWFFNATMADGRGFDENLRDMKQRKNRKGRNHLRYTGNQIYIDTFSMFFDTVIFIENTIQELSQNPSLKTKIVKNYYKILQGSYSSLAKYELVLTSNKEAKF